MRTHKMALFGNKFVNIRNKELYLDKIKVSNIPKNHKTPLFIFLENKIRENIRKIRKCFNRVFAKTQGFYSVKSNYIPEVLKIAKQEQFGAEIISIAELEILKSINYPMNKVIAGGPYLPDNFLEEIIKQKVGKLVVYKIEDIKRIQEKVEKYQIQNQKIILRFRAPKFTARHGIKLSREDLIKIEKYLKKAKNIEFCGILSHYGTRLKSYKNFKKNFDYLTKIMLNIKKFTNLEVKMINMGGGFPYADSLKEERFISILKRLKNILVEKKFQDIELLYEPGRFITADTGFCLAQIHHIQKDTNTLFLNVGNNYIPKFMKASLRFYNVSNIKESPNTPIDIMGNVPSDQDILVKRYNFPPNPTIGDFILVANVGAYAITWSTRFPYPKPKILMIKNKEIKVLYEGSQTLNYL